MEDGTYPAKPTGNVHVGDHENGCLICNMEFAFEGGGTIYNTFWMTTKDGAINSRTVDTLKNIFGWDGTDPFWLEDHGMELSEIGVELVIANETFTGRDGETKTGAKVKWVNPVGGSSNIKIANGDRKSLMAKYGAKLRAVSGGTPAQKKPVAAPEPPPTPDAPPAAKAKKTFAAPSDMNACWKAITTAMADKPREEVELKWFDIIKEVRGDKNQSDYTPGDWGAVMSNIKTKFDQVPF